MLSNIGTVVETEVDPEGEVVVVVVPPVVVVVVVVPVVPTPEV
jgi:hypothetical protein